MVFCIFIAIFYRVRRAGPYWKWKEKCILPFVALIICGTSCYMIVFISIISCAWKEHYNTKVTEFN